MRKYHQQKESETESKPQNSGNKPSGQRGS